MKRKLAIQYFIEQHADWEAILKEPPYSLDIKRDKMFGRNLILFKYNQIESDFSIGLVRECRGLVLDEDTLEVVVFPFVKFFNYGEKYASDIDWSSASVSSKMDGSIVKITKLNGNLLIGTNSNIDAFKANMTAQLGCPYLTFGDMIVDGLKRAYDAFHKNEEKYTSKTLEEKLEAFLTLLDENYTYIFEITSNFNQIVVKYPETCLYFIGVRNNLTYEEEPFESHKLSKYFKIPEIYPIHTLDKCLESVEKLGDNAEGFVVRDGKFNRIKVKCEHYLYLHRLAGNHILSIDRALEIVKSNEIIEIVSYFPDFEPKLKVIKEKYDEFISKLTEKCDRFMSLKDTFENRKAVAEYLKREFGPSEMGLGFAIYDGKVKDAYEWCSKLPTKNLAEKMSLDNNI